MKSQFSLPTLALGLLLPLPALAIEVGPLGAHGQGGARHGQVFRIGSAGTVHELDAFVQIDGVDLNQALPGTAVALSRATLPAGLTCTVTSTLSGDATDLQLTYLFANAGEEVLKSLQLMVLLDAENDECVNGFANEYAEAVGTPGRDASDGAPDSWQAGEPGFQTGSLYRKLLAGNLSNVNDVSEIAPDDVALALGFRLGNLQPGQEIAVRILISEDGTRLGDFALVQHDPAYPDPVIILSGQADINETPGEMPVDVTTQVQLAFSWQLDRPTGALVGRLALSLPADAMVPLSPPFLLGLQPSDSYRFVQPDGVHQSGSSYLDLTADVAAKLGVAVALTPGTSVVLDDVRVYSADRSPPPSSLFEFWAVTPRSEP